MQSFVMDNFQDKSENSLMDFSFENIGTTIGTESTLDNKSGTAENREDDLVVTNQDPGSKVKDSDVFDECMPMMQSTYREEQFNDRDEPFSVVESAVTRDVISKPSKPEKVDEVESDYMNPYASIRSQKDEKSSVPEESAAATFDEVAAELPPEPEIPVMSNVSNVFQQETGPVASEPGNECIKIEQMFKEYGLDAWFNPARLHPKVESLIYWRDVKKSAVVFGGGLAILLAMSLFSLISVFSYLSLLALAGTISFRIYKNVLQAVQKTSEGQPFKEYLDMDLTLSQEKVQQLTTVAVAYVNALSTGLRRLFLVEDLVDSIKFGVLLYWLTYVGAIFNGITCVMIGFVALFTLPKVYENNKQSIDTHIEMVRSKLQEITEKVKAAVPLGKKAETDKNK